MLVPALGQSPFWLGADLSYTNEMEDCGAVFKENGQPRDPFELFAEKGANMARFRLWHTPAWQDTLNSGKRYSDFQDVRKSILRAKTAGLAVLLDFHFSDLWADPQRQIVPKAWEPVVGNLPVLKDSLKNYVKSTLLALDSEGLLPEMVQIGNETNRGILLSPAQNAAGWSLDWPRNAALFNAAIQAVREVETQVSKKIKIAIHIADPAEASWLVAGFWSNGVKDFDVIGLSYYWAWHKPVTIDNCGATVAALRQQYQKEVVIFETGYIWTNASNDAASNIISETHPAYAPASPSAQKNWLIDLTKKVIEKGGSGVLYWEPTWVSTSCWTPWGQGSHQEHAAFFNFQNEAMPDGGLAWFGHDFGLSPASDFGEKGSKKLKIALDSVEKFLFLAFDGLEKTRSVEVFVFENSGRLLYSEKTDRYRADAGLEIQLPKTASGPLVALVLADGKIWASGRAVLP